MFPLVSWNQLKSPVHTEWIKATRLLPWTSEPEPVFNASSIMIQNFCSKFSVNMGFWKPYSNLGNQNFYRQDWWVYIFFLLIQIWANLTGGPKSKTELNKFSSSESFRGSPHFNKSECYWIRKQAGRWIWSSSDNPRSKVDSELSSIPTFLQLCLCRHLVPPPRDACLSLA